MQPVVDLRQPADLGLPGSQRLVHVLPGELRGEVDHRGDAAAGRGARADRPVVRRLVDAGVEHDVRVRVHQAGQHDAAGRVDHPVDASGWQVNADRRDLLAGEQEVAAQLAAGRDECAVLNQCGRHVWLRSMLI